MRDATSENRTAHAKAGRLRGCVPKLASSLSRFCLLGGLIYSGTAIAGTLHYGAQRLPMDPLFNLPYDPAQVHFQAASPGSVGDCGPLLDQLGRNGGQVKLFGRLHTAHASVLILGDENPDAPRGLSGVVLVIRDGSCRTSGPLLALRRTKVGDPDLDPGLSQTDVAMLMQDVLSRYAQAFGSKAAFLGWADRLTSEAAEAQREQPGMPCPLLYTSMFSPPMMHVLNDFRAS